MVTGSPAQAALRECVEAGGRGDVDWFVERFDVFEPVSIHYPDDDPATVARVQAWIALGFGEAMWDAREYGRDLEEFADRIFQPGVVVRGAPVEFRALMPAFIARGGPVAEVIAKSILSILEHAAGGSV